MSISTISDSTSTYQDRLSQLQSVRQDFTSLSSSLASGDLTTAQSAFATLMQDLGSTSAPTSQQTGVSSQISTDLTALGDALNSKDPTAAQKAFATLVQDLKAGRLHHGHRHHHKGNTQNNTDALKTDLTTLGTALQSGDLTAAQKAFATLMQDLGNNGTQNATAAGSTSTATENQGSTTASMLGTFQAASSTSQSGSASYAATLLQALNLYAQLGQFGLSSPTAALFSATG